MKNHSFPAKPRMRRCGTARLFVLSAAFIAGAVVKPALAQNDGAVQAQPQNAVGRALTFDFRSAYRQLWGV